MRRIMIAMSSLLLFPTALLAQAWGSIDLSIPMANSGFILSQHIVTMTTPSVSSSQDAGEGDEGGRKRNSASLAVPAATSNSAAKLARHYPVEKRADAERLFKELLTGHGQLMRQLNLPENDMASAVATFITGSYAAYHDRLIEGPEFVALVRQMRTSLADNEALASATPAERRDAYEQLVILGMMTATTQMAVKQNPNDPGIATLRANMRAAGDNYLRGFIGTDPGAIVLGPDGMTVTR